MTHQEFQKIIDRRAKLISDTLSAKGGEYASKADRMANFKQCAAVLGTTPVLALRGFMVKHLNSVLRMCEAPGEYSEATWTEKLGDSINYLVLLEGLLAEQPAIKVLSAERPLIPDADYLYATLKPYEGTPISVEQIACHYAEMRDAPEAVARCLQCHHGMFIRKGPDRWSPKPWDQLIAIATDNIVASELHDLDGLAKLLVVNMSITQAMAERLVKEVQGE